MASTLRAGSLVAAKPRTTVRAARSSVRVSAKVGNWFPGSTTPAYLDNVPGSYGFDPLGLAKEPASLQRFQEAELIHCRWAMAGVAGCLAVELAGQGDWFDAPKWAISGGSPTYLGMSVPFSLSTIAAVEFIGMAAAESQRGAEADPEKRKYPGGAFDPLGFAKDAKAFEELKLKELKNGRLAMLAFLGFVGQHYANGLSPLAALAKHLENPAVNNFGTNGVSVPFF